MDFSSTSLEGTQQSKGSVLRQEAKSHQWRCPWTWVQEESGLEVGADGAASVPPGKDLNGAREAWAGASALLVALSLSPPPAKPHFPIYKMCPKQSSQGATGVTKVLTAVSY